MSAETGQSGTPVVQGMLLIYEKQPVGVLPLRYELWTVKSVRKLKGGSARVTLLSGSSTLTAEGTATFPDGEVRDPFRVVELGQGDLARVWKGRP